MLAKRATLPSGLRSNADAQHARIQAALEHLAHLQDLAGLRAAFEEVSNATISLARTFGQPGDTALLEAFFIRVPVDDMFSWELRECTIVYPAFADVTMDYGKDGECFVCRLELMHSSPPQMKIQTKVF